MVPLARSQHICNCKYTYPRVLCLLPCSGISKEWRHIDSANCDFDREPLPCLCMYTGLSVKTGETAKIAHESHNDVRRMWGHAGAIFILLAELGLRKPPSRNPEGLACTFPLPLWSSNRRESGETWYSRVPWYSRVAAIDFHYFTHFSHKNIYFQKLQPPPYSSVMVAP